MGTRNLTIVKQGGKVKVAQYCQWDGYPTGQGKTLAKFIQEKLDLRKLKSKLSKIKFVTDKFVSDKWESVGAEGDFVSMEQSDAFKRKYPYLHRDIGADVLEIIQDGTYSLRVHNKDFTTKIVKIKNIEVDGLVNSISFLKDTLFCEYAYEVDLDKKTVKVYCGSTKPYKTYTFKSFTVANMDKLDKELKGDENA